VSPAAGDPGAARAAPDPAPERAADATRDALIDIGVALSRALDVERVYVEAARQARRAVRGAAFCLAVADEETAALRVAHAEGYAADTPAERARLEQRLLPAWLDALANEEVVARDPDAGASAGRPAARRPTTARANSPRPWPAPKARSAP
jgi:hypothetical protein